jgi:drug/metabolite transporter (DMT)-like permease
MLSGGVQLGICALLFGSTFLVMKQAVAVVQPLTFLALRFGFAALVLWPLARRRRHSPGEVRHGVMAGVSLLCGYVLQVMGLQHTSSSRSAFITYLLIVLVPIMEAVVLRRRIRATTVLGVVVALVGLVLLADPGAGSGGGFGIGEVLTLLCAFAFGAHIVILDRYAHRHDPIRLTQVQLVVVTVCCAVGAAVFGVGPLAVGSAWVAIIYSGAMATAVAFVLMVSGQRVVPASRVALILLLEPISAAVLGYLAGDRIGARGMVGAVVILCAIVISVRSRRPDPDAASATGVS